jgi:hypothetical protein
MKTIEVKSCGECPFIVQIDFDVCSIDESVSDIYLPVDKVHEDCPLKKESVTVKIKEQ